MKNKKLVVGGGIIGVISLGLITNAIWDALKPLTSYLFKFLLNLSVLGVEKFKDNIYIEIAKGAHENISLKIFLNFNAFILSFVLITIFLIFRIRRKNLLEEDSNLKPNFIDKIFNYQKDLTRKPWFLWFSLFYMIFAGTIFTLDSVKQSYINNAVTNFEQLSKIIRPYVSEEDNDKYISSFSQIKNREDYVILINKLQSIAKDNNQNIPEFKFTF